MIKKILVWVDRYHWIWLFLAAPFLVFPNSQRSLAMLVIPAQWILHLWVNRQEIRKPKIENGEHKIENRKMNIENSVDSSRRVRDYSGFPISPLNSSLLLLAIMMLISLWATYSIEQSLEKISGLVLGLGVYFAVVRESWKPFGWWLSLAAFLGGGLGWALLGFLGMNYQVRFSFLAPVISRIPVIIKDLPGAESGLQHNAVGGTLLWILPVMICLSWYALRYKIEKIKYKIEDWWFVKRCGVAAGWGTKTSVWVGTLFIGVVLLLTQSRGSYLAFWVTLVGILFLVLPRYWRWILLVLVGIAGIGLLLLLVQAGGWEAWISQLGLASQSGFSIDTLDTRLEIWTRAIYGVQDFPFTGMGMNTFREVVHALYPLFTVDPNFDIAHAHNEFLQAALDLGVPGLIAFISIYLIAFWMLVKVWQDTPQERSSPKTSNERTAFLVSQDPVLKKVLVLGLGGGLFGHMIFGMTDAITLGAKPGIFFWMFLGLITGMYGLVCRKSLVDERRGMGDGITFD